jgi:hypothetical protein
VVHRAWGRKKVRILRVFRQVLQMQCLGTWGKSVLTYTQEAEQRQVVQKHFRKDRVAIVSTSWQARVLAWCKLLHPAALLSFQIPVSSTRAISREDLLLFAVPLQIACNKQSTPIRKKAHPHAHAHARPKADMYHTALHPTKCMCATHKCTYCRLIPKAHAHKHTYLHTLPRFTAAGKHINTHRHRHTQIRMH